MTDAQERVHACLLDNINTGGAMDALASVIKATNLYLARKQEQQQAAAAARAQQNGGDGAGGGGGGSFSPQPLLLRKAAAYVTRILSVFGVAPAAADAPGLGGAAAAEGDGKGAAYLDAFSAFRDEVGWFGVRF